MTASREKGLQIFAEIYGERAASGLKAHLESNDFGVSTARWAMDMAFGGIWASDGLPRKMRSCAVLGMVIALQQVNEIGYHTKMALANGLTKAEIEEILTTAIPYCGLPLASTAKAAMLQAFAEVEGAA